jgi:hypothetical protein
MTPGPGLVQCAAECRPLPRRLLSIEDWLYERLPEAGKPELVHDLPWSTVWRVPRPHGAAWLKRCRAVQAHEPALTAALAGRWPSLLPELLGHDAARGLLLLGDAGTPVRAFGDALEAWRTVLPLYAELQRGEASHVEEHVAAGVPDQRVETLPAAFAEFPDVRLRPFAGAFAELCAQLTLPPTVQHDDLHDGNVYAKDGRVVVLDWGDTVIGHPFATMLVTLRMDEEIAGPLREAYLEAWPRDTHAQFDAAYRVAAFTRILSWKRIADATRDPKSYESLERNVEWFLENVASS